MCCRARSWTLIEGNQGPERQQILFPPTLARVIKVFIMNKYVNTYRHTNSCSPVAENRCSSSCSPSWPLDPEVCRPARRRELPRTTGDAYTRPLSHYPGIQGVPGCPQQPAVMRTASLACSHLQRHKAPVPSNLGSPVSPFPLTLLGTSTHLNSVPLHRQFCGQNQQASQSFRTTKKY